MASGSVKRPSRSVYLPSVNVGSEEAPALLKVEIETLKALPWQHRGVVDIGRDVRLRLEALDSAPALEIAPVGRVVYRRVLG